MNQEPEVNNLSNAYNLALDLGDEVRIQRTREAMVSFNTGWALRTFMRNTADTDEIGVDYALATAASRYGVGENTLRTLVEKYYTD